MTFHPAPENFGYRICRIDLPNSPIITALSDNVIQAQHSVTLSEKGVQVSSVEHVLASLYGCEIDNCLIEINGPEFPIMDGSSIPFVKMLKTVGIREQNEFRKYIELKRKRIKVKDESGESSLILLPDESFSIQVRVSFDSILLRSQNAFMSNLSSFPRDIARARTFVFIKEIIPLLEANLMDGGSLDNAIVIYDHYIDQVQYKLLSDRFRIKSGSITKLGYIMNRSLIYDNEFAKHKLLDIVGDIALTGSFIKGKIIANCPGHEINTLFAKTIREVSTSIRKEKVTSLKSQK